MAAADQLDKLVKQTSEPAPPGLIRPVLQVETCDPAKLPRIVGNQHQFATRRLGADERSWKLDDRFAFLVRPRSAALPGQRRYRPHSRSSQVQLRIVQRERAEPYHDKAGTQVRPC